MREQMVNLTEILWKQWRNSGIRKTLLYSQLPEERREEVLRNKERGSVKRTKVSRSHKLHIVKENQRSATIKVGKEVKNT